MLQMVSLSLTSISMIGALFLMARHNRKSGWTRERHYLAEEIQETMDHLIARQSTVAAPVALRPEGLLTPEVAMSFSLQLAQLHSTLATQPSVAPAVATSVEHVAEYAAKV